jgi:hypothetical protein
MAVNWVDASTDEYWGGGSWPTDTTMDYLGGGAWEAFGGPGARLVEQETSPFVGDPYEYIDGTQMFGIRFRLSISFGFWVDSLNVCVYTSEGRSFCDDSKLYVEGANNHLYEFEITPESTDERFIRIEVFGNFGTDYGDDPLIYDIQVKISDGDSFCRWQSFVGTVEIC